MIDWNKYFDHIFVISRCINFDRRKYMDEQFKNLGITNYKYWYVPDYDCENSIIFKPHIYTVERFRCTFGHYSLWKACYELNYDNILLIEDDAKFIENLDIIKEMLDIYASKQTDIYLFDYDLFREFPNFNFYYLGTCYGLHKNGLKYLVKQHEKYNLVCDNYFYKFKSEELKNSNEASFIYSANNLSTHIIFDNEDLNIILDTSPIKIVIQPDKVSNEN